MARVRVLGPRVVLMHSDASSTDALQDSGDGSREGAGRLGRSRPATKGLRYVPRMSSLSVRAWSALRPACGISDGATAAGEARSGA